MTARRCHAAKSRKNVRESAPRKRRLLSAGIFFQKGDGINDGIRFYTAKKSRSVKSLVNIDFQRIVPSKTIRILDALALNKVRGCANPICAGMGEEPSKGGKFLKYRLFCASINTCKKL